MSDMTADRDAARPAEGAPDAAFEAWLAERVDFAATSLLGLTLRPTFDAGWDAAVAARPAPPAAPREGKWDYPMCSGCGLPYDGHNPHTGECWNGCTCPKPAAAREAARGDSGRR